MTIDIPILYFSIIFKLQSSLVQSSISCINYGRSLKAEFGILVTISLATSGPGLPSFLIFKNSRETLSMN